jgi:hypothetical protein
MYMRSTVLASAPCLDSSSLLSDAMTSGSTEVSAPLGWRVSVTNLHRMSVRLRLLSENTVPVVCCGLWPSLSPHLIGCCGSITDGAFSVSDGRPGRVRAGRLNAASLR